MASTNHLNYFQNCVKFQDEIDPFLNGGRGGTMNVIYK